MTAPLPHPHFGQWLLQERHNKTAMAVLLLLLLVQFITFKLCYPFPNFLPDSYSYLETAYTNEPINMWPIGYSKFLRIISCFTRSDTALIFIQYFLLEAAQFYLLFSLIFLLKIKAPLNNILLGIGALNPLLLHTANFISSDALFGALSIVWATQLIWMLYKPRFKLLLLHSIVCFLAFTVRYNALYYPVISCLLLLILRYPIQQKIIVTALTLCLPVLFIGFTMAKYKTQTGAKEFSPFSGWQLASNAMYGYAHVSPAQREQPPAAFKGIHAVVNQHMDSINRLRERPDAQLGIYYLWNDAAPLRRYTQLYYQKDTSVIWFKRWANMAKLYRQYGNYVSKTYPMHFLQYYLWPNAIRYYCPDSEFLGYYNMRDSIMEPMAPKWFGYKHNKPRTAFSTPEIYTMQYFPILLAMINLLFFLCLISFLLLDGIKKNTRLFNQSLLLILILWSANLVFSVLASPIVLRYQLFPMCITLPYLVLLIKYLLQQVSVAKEG